jgi:hypothetical protein
MPSPHWHNWAVGSRHSYRRASRSVRMRVFTTARSASPSVSPPTNRWPTASINPAPPAARAPAGPASLPSAHHYRDKSCLWHTARTTSHHLIVTSAIKILAHPRVRLCLRADCRLRYQRDL